MVQSHLLQMLALVAMEKPLKYETEYIRDEKVKVLRSLRIDRPSEDLVFGQYEGYLGEKHVAPDSQTESFVALKVSIDNPRWRGVPFYLKTGKALDEKRAEIIIRFKCSEDDYSADQVANNLLIIKIQPEEGVYFRINVKEPGMNAKVMQESMEYCQSCKVGFKSVGAYEKLLADVMRDEKTLFTRWDELEQAWRVVDEIRHWRKKYQLPLHRYPQRTEGPRASFDLLGRDGLYWMNGRVVD
jgi:glucose-6-phosphate 1-dehydrogenase